MDDDADFAVRLQNQVTGPAREMTRAIRQVKDQFKALDDAMAHQNWVAMKRGQIAAKKQADVLRMAEIKSARMGGFDFGDIASRGAIAGITGVTVAAVAAAAAITYLGARFAAASVQGAEFAQTSKLALKLLIGDAASAEREFDAVRNEAQGLGLDIKETQKSFQKLLAAQFSVGQAKEIIRMGADLQAIGADAEQVQRAILAITQIKSKGRVQAEELLQLQEAGISQELVFEALQKQLGKTRDEVRKLIEEGKVDSGTALLAIGEAVKKKTGVKEFGEAGKQFADSTITGMRARAMAGFQNLFIDIGTAIEPILAKIAPKVFGLFDTIIQNPAVQGLGQRMLGQLELFGIWVEANWPAIEASIVGGVELMAAGFQMMNDVLDWAIINWDTISTTLTGVAWVLGILAVGAFTAMIPLYLAVAAVGAVVAAIAFAIGWAVDNAGMLWEAIVVPLANALLFMATLPQQFFQFGISIVQGLIGGITSMIGSAVSTVANLGGSVLQGFKSAMGIASPSKPMQEFGAFTVQGFTGEIAANDTTVQGATAGMASQALSGFDAGISSVEGPAGGGAAGGAPITINVYQQPGESGQDLAARIRAELETLFEGEAEAAA